MICASCGGAVPEGGRFCPSCGRALGPATAAAAMTQLAGAGLTVAAVASDALADFTPGQIVAGRYRIERALGRGGMGVVYQAFDERLDHEVALKFLPDSLASDPRRLAQFHNEVKVARLISHPNVCRVYDIGDVGGHLFLSMEYVDGEDLASLVARQGAFGEQGGVDLVRQICAGLAAVHAQGILHRDLKPANIMVTRGGRAQLMDFGIAAAADVDESVEGHITEGTPAYMSPEQLAGRDLTARSDIYALGLVMHEVFSGQRLIDMTALDELPQRHRDAPERSAAALAHLQPSLREAVACCLDPDPDKRPASAGEVAAMLQIVLLDARTRWRRLMQVGQQLLFVPILIVGVSLLMKPSAGSRVAGALMLLAGAAIAIAELRYPLGWSVSYKGHRIRFQNHPFFGERLYIDDVLVDRGRFGLQVTLRGTIERGEGAGERITAHAGAGFTLFTCRIVAEAFAPSPRA